MQVIIVEPENATLLKSGNVLLPIYFQLKNKVFPEKGWTDFGIVILRWWLLAVRSGSASFDLEFMDGPFLMRVVVEGNMANMFCVAELTRDSAVKNFASVPLFELEDSILTASTSLVQSLKHGSFQSDDFDELKAVI